AHIGIAPTAAAWNQRKMEATATMAISDYMVIEILTRVNDVATLYRCKMASKQLRRLVADPFIDRRKTASLLDMVILEILVRVRDAATLFRCATACKWWRALICDPCFLLRRWPPTRKTSIFVSLAATRVKERVMQEGTD
uniref:F-box domain-containing protein n=1 Tax=Aegilops tauschii subsp. strangulata TaxID=200361 RepID=A0A453GX45_AEGTS